MRRIKDVAERN